MSWRNCLQTETTNQNCSYRTGSDPNGQPKSAKPKSPVPFLNNNFVWKTELQINISQTEPDEQLQHKAIFTKGCFLWIFPLSEWQPWRTWSRCSKTCGSGTRRRTRSCTNGPGCSGLNEDTETCIVTQCPGEKANLYKYIYSFEYHVLLNYIHACQKINYTIIWIYAVWIHDFFISCYFHRESIFSNPLRSLNTLNRKPMLSTIMGLLLL